MQCGDKVQNATEHHPQIPIVQKQRNDPYKQTQMNWVVGKVLTLKSEMKEARARSSGLERKDIHPENHLKQT